MKHKIAFFMFLFVIIVAVVLIFWPTRPHSPVISNGDGGDDIGVLGIPVANISVNATEIRLGVDSLFISGAGSISPNGNISEYKWSLYGRVIGYGENLLYRFDNAGVYTLTLHVVDNKGKANDSQVIVNVNVPKYSFAEALAKGYIEARFTGTGSCCGDCIELHVRRLVNFSIDVDPPENGAELENTGDAQNMVIQELKGEETGEGSYSPSIDIELTVDEKVYIFSAYCLNFNKDNPESTDSFRLLSTKHTEILKVFDAVETLPYSVTDITAVQTAIWVITDNITLTELRSTFPDGANQLENVHTILDAAGVETSSKALFSS